MELSKEVVTLVLGTGLVSAFITALFSKFQSDKNHKVENITKERKEWRDCIRRIVLDVVKAYQNEDEEKLHRLEAELRVRLNPNDKSDKKILAVISDLRKEDASEVELTEFCERISYLLKHDWERVKKETAATISILNLFWASLFSTAILTAARVVINIPTNLFVSGGLLTALLFALHGVNYLKSKIQPKYDRTFKIRKMF